MHIIINILKIWAIIGAIPLTWDLHKAFSHGLLNGLIFLVLYPVLGPFSWIVSMLANCGTVG